MSEPHDPVDVVIEDGRWERVGLAALAEAAVLATLRHEGVDPARHEVAVLGCDDARIAALNDAFRGRAAPTNVLAWPTLERDPARPPQPGELGDIALAFETCRAEAGLQGKPMRDHATHLVVHATLHLLGHDHDEDGAARLMEGREVSILGSMGLPDPYVPRDGGGDEDPVRRQEAPPFGSEPSEARH